MSDDRAGSNDEPLEGDIGPAAGVGASPSGGNAREELRRAEVEREQRRRRTDAVSGRIVVVVAAVFLAFLTYDSVRTAAAARAKGDDWIYPPAVIAGICALALSTLLTWAWRRVK